MAAYTVRLSDQQEKALDKLIEDSEFFSRIQRREEVLLWLIRMKLNTADIRLKD